jgi:hypothetical protein
VITADQLVAHAVGDYVLQSDWMAREKVRRSWAALCHIATYGLPFLLLRPTLLAYVVIVGSHFVIDHWRLARYVCWAKNFLAPVGANRPWSECRATGYPDERPAWMTVWLMIVADNVMHVLINGAALRWFA